MDDGPAELAPAVEDLAGIGFGVGVVAFAAVVVELVETVLDVDEDECGSSVSLGVHKMKVVN